MLFNGCDERDEYELFFLIDSHGEPRLDTFLLVPDYNTGEVPDPRRPGMAINHLKGSNVFPLHGVKLHILGS